MIAPNDPRDAAVEGPGGSTEFRVRLEDVYAGPLDLLLHLVKEHEVEITQVSLARICNEFLRYVRDIAEVDLERAGDYLVVAATLLALKSRALVPSAEPVDLDEDLGPGDDLVKRLLQYRRVRDASRDLAERAARRERLFPRGTHDMPAPEPGEIDLSDLGAWDLLSAFAAILRQVGKPEATHRIGRPDRPLREFARDVYAVLVRTPRVRFRELFEGAPDRDWVIGMFLALLELGKQGAIRIEQTGVFGEIDILRAEEDPREFERAVEGLDARGDLEGTAPAETSTEGKSETIVPAPFPGDTPAATEPSS